jgi:hypothetical protein
VSDQGSATAPGAGEGQAVGSPPQSGSPTSGEAGVSREQFLSARQKITEQGEQISGYRDILQTMASHPDKNFVEVKGYIDSGRWADTETPQEVYGEMLGDFKEEIRGPLAEVLQQVETRTREQVMREMQPVVQQTAQIRQTAEYTAGLTDGGLSASDAQNPLVQEVEAEMSGEAWYKDLKSRHPRAAAKLVADKVQTVAGFADQQRSLNGARNSSLAMGGRNGALAGRGASSTQLPRTATMRDILKAHQGGASDVVFNQ